METDTAKRRSRKVPQPTGLDWEVTRETAERLLEPASRYSRLPTSYLIDFYRSAHVKKILKNLWHEPSKLPETEHLFIRHDRGVGFDVFHQTGPAVPTWLTRRKLRDHISHAWVETTKVGGTFKEPTHDNTTCLITASIELAARKRGITFLSHIDILNNASRSAQFAPHPLNIPIGAISHQFPNGVRKNLENALLVPDALFGLRYSLPNGKTKTAYFALEYDTGSEAREPTQDLKRASWVRKVVSYTKGSDENYGAPIYKYLGINNLRVLAVLPNLPSVAHVQEIAARDGYPAQYLYKVISAIPPYDRQPKPMYEIFNEPWQSASGPVDLSQA